jgi:hypothetical protein
VSAPVNDTALREAYARLLAAREQSMPATDVPLEAIVALVERRGPEAERVALLDRIMASPSLRAEFDELRAAMPAALATSWRWQRTAALAASLIIVAGVSTWVATPRRREGDGTVMRGAGSATVTLRAERVRSDTIALRWHAVAGARTYTVELLDETGSAVASHTTSDTLVIIGGSELARARSAWLRAVMSDGSERTSPAVQLPRS